jgi:hypothetical protein
VAFADNFASGFRLRICLVGHLRWGRGQACEVAIGLALRIFCVERSLQEIDRAGWPVR